MRNSEFPVLCPNSTAAFGSSEQSRSMGSGPLLLSNEETGSWCGCCNNIQNLGGLLADFLGGSFHLKTNNTKIKTKTEKKKKRPFPIFALELKIQDNRDFQELKDTNCYGVCCVPLISIITNKLLGDHN